MSEYVLIIIWLAFMAVVSHVYRVHRIEYVAGRKVERMNYFFAFLVFLPIIIWAGTRSHYWADTALYTKLFQAMPSSFSGMAEYLESVNKDKGFSALSVIIKVLFGNNPTTYYIVLAAIQGFILIYIFRKYSSDYIMSVFLFIASTDFLSWMFNGIRQFTAVTIVFAATPLLIKKKYVPLIMIILLASTVHGSMLLMIPIIFIVQGQAWNKKSTLVIISSILVIAFVDQFTNGLDTLLSDTQYTNVVSDWVSMGDDGTNILRVLVYSMPAIMALIGRRAIRNDNDVVINICVNMSIISAGLYIVSSVTSGIYIGRLPIMVSLYSYILLPYLLDRMFTKETGKIVKLTLIGMYIIFYYMQLKSWGSI